MALRTIRLKKKIDLLNQEANQLRTVTIPGFTTRETSLAAQIENATTDAELAAAASAAEELENAQKTALERLATIASEVEALQAELAEAEASADDAAAGADTAEDSESRATRSTAHWETRRYSKNWERRCKDFLQSGRMLYRNAFNLLTRSALLSSSQGVEGPTGVGGINEPVGSTPSSLLDLVTITDCTGMSAYKVVYQITDAEASAGTEGKVPAESAPTFGSVEFKPALYDVITYVSKFIQRYTPLRYEEVIRKSIAKALRAVVSKLAVTNLLASDLVDTLDISGTSGSALFTQDLLSDLILGYGGDETVEGNAVLLMNKADLRGFARVLNEDGDHVYSYTPDAASSSTGIIRDNNGLTARYVLNKNVPALYGATLTSSAKKFMAYGDPKNLEVAMWGDMEVDVSKDYKFGEGLLSVRGDVTADAKVNAKHGFVVVSAKLST